MFSGARKVSAGVTVRKPASLQAEGVQRKKRLVNALPFVAVGLWSANPNVVAHVVDEVGADAAGPARYGVGSASV